MSDQVHISKKVKTGKEVIILNILAYSFCSIISILCLIPFIMVLTGSLSSEEAIVNNGFSLLIQDFSLDAYKTVFNKQGIRQGAIVTVARTALGSILALGFCPFVIAFCKKSFNLL